MKGRYFSWKADREAGRAFELKHFAQLMEEWRFVRGELEIRRFGDCGWFDFNEQMEQIRQAQITGCLVQSGYLLVFLRYTKT